MSFFEILMLICFGAAWPFSIYKSYTSRRNNGKSLIYLCIVVLGYIAGIFHKLLYNYDPVIFLYALNCVMVSVDIALYCRNRRLAREYD